MILQLIHKLIRSSMLDHLIHTMKLSGKLAKLTDQQVENIMYALQEGRQTSYRDMRDMKYDDGLLFSLHSAKFLDDPLFLEAYQLGRDTESWVGFDKRWCIKVLCWAAQYASKLDGDFVECGANGGGYARAQIHYINFQNITYKRFYLLDSLWTLPEKYESSSEKYYREVYANRYKKVCETFKSFDNVKIIRGAMPDSLSQVNAIRIAYLSIRTNSSEPEAYILHHFWDKLIPGAIIILDDTGTNLIERKHYKTDALDVYLKGTELKVLPLPTGQGLIIKHY